MSKPGPLKQYHLTNHAQIEMARRQITKENVIQVLSSPEQIEILRSGRAVYQSLLIMEDNPTSTYLLRVFVDHEHEPPDVVTVYRTSKINKYWRSGS